MKLLDRYFLFSPIELRRNYEDLRRRLKVEELRIRIEIKIIPTSSMFIVFIVFIYLQPILFYNNTAKSTMKSKLERNCSNEVRKNYE